MGNADGIVHDAGVREVCLCELTYSKNATQLHLKLSLQVLVIFSLVFVWEPHTPNTWCLLSRKFFITFLEFLSLVFFTSIFIFYQTVPVASQYFTLRCFNYV